MVDGNSAEDEEGIIQGEIIAVKLLGASHILVLLSFLLKEKMKSKLRKMRHIYLIFQKQIKSLTS